MHPMRRRNQKPQKNTLDSYTGDKNTGGPKKMGDNRGSANGGHPNISQSILGAGVVSDNERATAMSSQSSLGSSSSGTGSVVMDTNSPSGAEILAAIQASNKELGKKMEAISADITGMNERLDKVATDSAEAVRRVGEVVTSLEFTQKEVKSLQDKHKEYDARFLVTNTRFQDLRDENKRLKEELLSLERHSRDYSVRINHVAQPQGQGVQGEDCHQLAAETIVNCGWSPLTVVEVHARIEVAHRVGKAYNGQRQIIARFFSRPERDKILKVARTCWTAEGPKIYPDMPREDLARKKRAAPFMSQAYAAGHRVAFRRGDLVVDGRRWEKIPSGDNIESALDSLRENAEEKEDRVDEDNP